MAHQPNQKTVLVVEDEPFIRMSAVAALEDAGFLVLEARNSAEALRMLARHTEICVLLTDVRMPGRMDGLALIAQVRGDYPAIRSIVVSGNVSANEASSVGASRLICKPYLPQSLIRAVNDTMLVH